MLYVRPESRSAHRGRPRSRRPTPTRYLARDAATRFPGVPTRTRAERGEAAERICEVAAEERADTIVIGNRGAQGARWRVRDSVPNMVLRHAPCSRVHRRHAEGAVTRPATPVRRQAPVSRRNASTAITRRCTSGSSVRSSLWNRELMCFSTARSVRNSDSRDRGVVLALRHVREDLALAVGELRERGVRHPVLRGDERLDDLRVEDAAAPGDLVERPDELVHVGDALLQQVAEPGGAVLQQVVGVLLLGELREDDDADLRVRRRGSASRPRCPRSCPSAASGCR